MFGALLNRFCNKSITRQFLWSTIPSSAIFRKSSSTTSLKGHDKIVVTYGTMTGTSQLFADNLTDKLTALGKTSLLLDPKESAPEQLLAPEKGKLLIFIMSCYGAGEPCDNAKELYNYITSPFRKNGDFKDIEFAAFGLGQSITHKEHYNIVIRNMENCLSKYGAKSVYPTGYGDDAKDIDADFDAWCNGFLNAVKSSSSSAASVSEENLDMPYVPTFLISNIKLPTIVKTKEEQLETQRLYYGSESFASNILYNKIVTVSKNRPGMEMGLELPNLNFSYSTGDHVAVYPENCKNLVNDLINHLGIASDTPILIDSLPTSNKSISVKIRGPITAREAFTRYVDLTNPPTHKAVVAMSRVAESVTDKQMIESWCVTKAAYNEHVRTMHRSLLEVLKSCPSVKLDLCDVLHLQQPLLPRFYSICSSSIKFPDQIHISYRPLEFTTPLGIKKRGVCSNWLKDQNEQAIISLRASTFRLPSNRRTPLVMLAAGTGIAPIKSFIEERLFSIQSGKYHFSEFGPALLIFCANTRDEIFYPGLFEEAVEYGALTDVRVLLADQRFSSGKPQFINGLLDGDSGEVIIRKEKGSAPLARSHVYDLFQQNASVYMCGGFAFGRSATSGFKQLLTELSHSNGEDIISEMVKNKRYHEDLAE